MVKRASLHAPRYWPIWVICGLLWLLAKLPYPCLLALGRFIGLLLRYTATRMRHTTQINLTLCFPELTKTEQEQLLKKNFTNLGIAAIETLLAFFASDKKIASLITLHHFDHVETALRQNKAVVLLGPHLTSFQCMGRIFAQHRPLTAMYNPLKSSLLMPFYQRYLNRYYQGGIPRNNLRKLIKSLKQKQIVWYTTDVDAGHKNSVFAPFFNIATASTTVIPRLARDIPLVAIPISHYRREDNTGYDFYFHPPLENFPSGDLIGDVTQINRALEEAVRKQPEHYLWQYKRFKSRPNDEEGFYG